MASIVGLNDLSEALIDAGNSLLSLHSSTDELLTLLDETETLLRNVEQDQPLSMQNALIPSKNALVSAGLLSHPDSDVRVSVVSCLTEIVRITAPEAPYSDDQMKEIFRLTIEAFEKLADTSSRSYSKAESVLDNVSKVRSCLVMLDLECHDLILQMFRNFLKTIRSDHPRVVFSSMEMIMISIIDETEEVSTDLLDTLLACVKNENKNGSPMSWSLVEKVLSRCARKLKPYIIKALKSTGTTLDMYSPVVLSVCQTVYDTTPKAINIVSTKVDETRSRRKVAPSNSMEDFYLDKLDLRHSKRSSKRPARDGTIRINEDDKVRNGNNLNLAKQSLKRVWSESRDAETDLGVTGKRGRKPNSLMNPEEGYDISWISGKRDSFKTSSKKRFQKRGSRGESSRGKLAAKKTSSASRVKMDESDHDLDSPSSLRVKELASCFRDEETLEKESNQESYEIPEDDRKIGNSSKKTRSQNGIEKSQRSAKKTVNSSGKRSSARSNARKKNLESASPHPQSSKGKKVVSQARPLAEESEEASKNHPTRRRTARKEVESDMIGFGKDLVDKRVNIWWPLDKTYYEGVVKSYCSRKKMHLVVYTDGDSEELNLAKERWKLLEDLNPASEDEEIDLPESVPLSDIMQRQKVKKGKNVEPASSSGVRSSSRKSNKQGERGKEGKNLKSLKELNAETDRREEQEVSRDVDHKNEDDDCSESQEQSGDIGDDEESLKSEAETKEEEKHSASSEVESEREDSGSEEEPRWRETEDMEDEAEEKEDVDDKETSTRLSSEIEKDEDEDED
uniref:Sister chromatid cohesion protein PDS5-like protein B-B n=1 Tax=Noccaea caerulescens TaxID=107243 RepID=A0A1J3J2X5_NOCCA